MVYLRIAKAASGQRGRSEGHRVGEAGGGDDAEEGSDEPPLAEDEQQIRCTTEHPFWVVGRGWIGAGELVVGDRLVGSQGEDLVVSGHEVREEQADHYNFEVADWHTYFVSETEDDPAVWVHNFCEGARRVLTDTWADVTTRTNRQLSMELRSLWNQGHLKGLATRTEVEGIARLMYSTPPRLRGRGMSFPTRGSTTYGSSIDLVMKGRIRSLQAQGKLSPNVRVNPRGGVKGPDIYWTGSQNTGAWIDMTGTSRSAVHHHLGKYPGSGEVWTNTGGEFITPLAPGQVP